MGTVLKNILNFTGLVIGVPVSLPHLLNLNTGGGPIPKIPRICGMDAAGFTATADATDVTVTRLTDALSDHVHVYVEYWHSIEDIEPAGGIPSGYFPFVLATGLASAPAPAFPDIVDVPGVSVTMFGGTTATTPLGTTARGFQDVAGGQWNDPNHWAAPASASGVINDYDPAGAISGGQTELVLQPAPNVGLTITGMAATVPVGYPGTPGHIITIVNPGRPPGSPGGEGPITLKHDDAGSAIGNRFKLPGNQDLVLQIHSAATFINNGTCWLPLSNSKLAATAATYPDISDNPGVLVTVGVNTTITGNLVVDGAAGVSSVAGFFTTGPDGAVGTNDLTVYRLVNLSSGLVMFGLAGPFTPPLLVANANNYNPVGWIDPITFQALVSGIYQDCNAGLNVTGLACFNGGTRVTWWNTSNANSITFKHQNGASDPSNRFTLPGSIDLVVVANGSVTFVHDGFNWRVEQ